MKIISILFVSLILISGMHLSFASHYCGGKLAASIISFSEQKADCGMVTRSSECPIHSKNQINSDCCKNVVFVYSIEKNYKVSAFEFKQFTLKVLQVFTVPTTIRNLEINTLSTNTNVSPQIYLQISAVSLPGICVFRI